VNQNKITFCNTLVDIRNRVIKSDGFLAGGSTAKFDVSDIDVTKVWRSMQHLAENNVAAGALKLLMDDKQVGQVAAILCMNTSDSNEALAARIDEHCEVFGGSSLMVVREARASGLDLKRAIASLNEKVFGVYSVRGVPFGPQMKDLVSMACWISARADTELPIDDEIDDATVLDALTMAHSTVLKANSTPQQLSRALAVLKNLDGDIRSNGSAASIKGHVSRLAHRYWFQRGICPDFMRETIGRLIVKVANATAISDEDYFHMEYLYRSAAILCKMMNDSSVNPGQRQIAAAADLHFRFGQMVDRHSDAYVSLTFFERFGDDFSEWTAMFSEADVYAKAAGKGIDADDRNSVIVNQPVTRKVGTATVHTGERLASQGSLFDAISEDTEEADGSLFDTLSED